jgi:hypothetical protein
LSGKSQDWVGLHKHNIKIENEDILWSNRDGTIIKLNISNKLDMELFLKKIQGSMYVMVYRKNG